MWFDPWMTLLLRSPLHGMLDKSTMLKPVAGRKSGLPYTTPVNYVRTGDVLLTTSFKARTWWRNLRGGAPVTVHLEGVDQKGRAEVVEDEAGVMESLKAIIQASPQFARYLAIQQDASGQLDPSGLRQAAHDKVVIRTRLVDRNN